MKDIGFVRELFEIKKKQVLSNEDLVKIKNLEFILTEDDVFFKIDVNTALGILSFLGIKDEELLGIYSELISPENYHKLPKKFINISNSL